jgi:hypothetical protein
MNKKGFSFILILICLNANAQIDSTQKTEEEDYSQYENVVIDSSAKTEKTYCNPKIFDLSPNRFISVGYDFVSNYKLTSSPIGQYDGDEKPKNLQSTNFKTYGLRINANIPIISKTKLLWQLGGGIIQSKYSGSKLDSINSSQKILFNNLEQNGLLHTNLNTTIFKPLGVKTFMIVQGMGELNGNFGFDSKNNAANFSNIRTSLTLLLGKRPHDRLQWALGLSRTYRGGELNYIPVIMYNYTSVNRKWGTEILFPARAAYRRKFTSRSILLAGYELEGNSYRLYNTNLSSQNIELRRSELRIKLDYQRQLKGFVWIAIQAGLRHNITYNVDSLGSENKDFFRGFFGTQKYIMLNEIGLAPYFNVSINLVSP